MIQIKKVTFAGKTLISLNVSIGDNIGTILRTVPEWIQDAYQGMLVDASSLKEGEKIRFFSFDRNRLETTGYEITRIEMLTDNSLEIENGKEN